MLTVAVLLSIKPIVGFIGKAVRSIGIRGGCIGVGTSGADDHRPFGGRRLQPDM